MGSNGKAKSLILHILFTSLLGFLASGPEALAGDVNGDGKADLLWRNVGTGEVQVWLLTGATVQEDATFGRVSIDWLIAGIGDFNGDGKADLLWRHVRSGQVDVWFLNGAKYLGGASFGRVSLDWQVVGIGDFNGDRRADVLWRNVRTGQVDVWFLNGAKYLGGASFGRVSLDWQVVGIGDFNGDRRADVLWRNVRTGQVDVWFLNGAIQPGGTTYGTLPVSSDWQIARIGDFNGDGKADILWRNVATTEVMVWLLNGSSIVSNTSFGTMPVAWQIVGSGDFNGDGKTDLLWHQTFTDELDIWFLNGPNVASIANLGQVANAWQIQDDQGSPPFLVFTAHYATPYNAFTSAVSDVNEDGWVEVISSVNDGQGHLQLVAPNSIGLGDLFAGSRVPRDTRFADFNGDGHLDLVSNAYDDIANTDSIALLFFGNGKGIFSEDPQFSSKSIRGFGETVVVADFDNDGDLDIFIPYYTFNSTTEQCYLLINDGQGHFTDIADAAGVSLRNRPNYLRPEGAQAVDFNNDGWIDLYVGGHFFINKGNLTFTDQRAALGLPELFDEGIKFLDWNNDGLLDLIIYHPISGPHLFEFNGSVFRQKAVFSAQSTTSNGMNVYDLNNDGREDIVIEGGPICNTLVYLNTGLGFVRARALALDSLCNGTSAPTFSDFNGDGRIDMTSNFQGSQPDTYVLGYFINGVNTQNSWLSIEVLGAQGERNQFGRVVTVSPLAQPGVTFTRVVDGGSGWLSQTQYPLLIGTPYLGRHQVQVFYAGRTVVFTMTPGRTAHVFADGTYSID